MKGHMMISLKNWGKAKVHYTRNHGAGDEVVNLKL